MGRTKMAMAVAVAVVALVGVSAAITLGNAGSTHPTTSRSPEKSSAVAATGDQAPTIIPAQGPGPTAAAGAPRATAPIVPSAQPTAEDVQRILAGITAAITAPPSSAASTQPLTKEQVEQEVRSQLGQLGINF